MANTTAGGGGGELPLLKGQFPPIPADASAVAKDDATTALLRRHFPRYFFDREEDFYPCDINKYRVDQTVAYGCNGTALRSDDGIMWLTYLNFYLEDTGLQVCGCGYACCTQGEHFYDLEVVVVELDPTGAVAGVCYAPHGSSEHFWIGDQDDLDEILGGEGGDGLRPKVFVSRGKHASYPVGGTVTRIFGFANDVCMDPVESKIPFVPLTQATIELEQIDGVFAGPATKIGRDWSLPPVARLSSVRTRQFWPGCNQITRAFCPDLSGCCCCASSSK